MEEHPRTGNFVKLEPVKPGSDIYGIVTGFTGYSSENAIFVDSYDMGFPINTFVRNCLKDRFWLTSPEPDYDVTILMPQQFLEHLEEQRDGMKPYMKSEDLIAACWASREHYLDGVINKIRANGKPEQHHHQIKPEFPGTGIYVLSTRHEVEEDRCRLDPSKTNLEGIVIEPRVSPGMASRIITAWYGPNFKSVQGFEDASGIAYFCHEVPEHAKEYVKNPDMLKGPR